MDLVLLKFAIFTLLLVILFMSESLMPYFPGRKGHASHTGRNLSLAMINAIAGAILLGTLIFKVSEYTQTHSLGLLNALVLPIYAEFICAIVLFDAWQYAWHRLNHRLPVLWRLHRVHHADKEMDASTGVRFHTLEIILSGLLRLAVIPVIGLKLEHLLVYELIALPVIIFHHSNIRINETLDRVLRVVIVTPHMHRLHHSEIRTETDSNYSSLFSVWDRLFSSYTMRNITYNFNLGLGEEFNTRQWNSVFGMLKIPFEK